jgi:DNA-binding MarR family transcriptional regulator
MDIKTDMNRAATGRVPADLVSSSQFLLKRLGFAAKERALAAYEQVGLNPYHHAVLSLVSAGAPETQGEIADALGYDRGQLVGLLDDLEAEGLVERRRDPEDRRRHIVRATPAGTKALRKLQALAATLDGEFLEPLDEEERSTLHDLLLRLAEHHDPRCARGTPPDS